MRKEGFVINKRINEYTYQSVSDEPTETIDLGICQIIPQIMLILFEQRPVHNRLQRLFGFIHDLVSRIVSLPNKGCIYDANLL